MRITEGRIRQIIREEIAGAVDEIRRGNVPGDWAPRWTKEKGVQTPPTPPLRNSRPPAAWAQRGAREEWRRLKMPEPPLDREDLEVVHQKAAKTLGQNAADDFMSALEKIIGIPDARDAIMAVLSGAP